MVLAMAAGGLRVHELAIWSLDGADLGIRRRHNHLHNMSNRESRRKTKLAALSRFTAKDLIGLRFTSINWNPIDPPWLAELPNPLRLSDLVKEVRRRWAVLFSIHGGRHLCSGTLTYACRGPTSLVGERSEFTTAAALI
jgi:hypothetical protein